MYIHIYIYYVYHDINFVPPKQTARPEHQATPPIYDTGGIAIILYHSILYDNTIYIYTYICVYIYVYTYLCVCIYIYCNATCLTHVFFRRGERCSEV